MKYLDDLKDAFKNDEIQINDEATLREMMTITIEDSGDIVMNGKDRTVALGISIQAIKQAVIPGTIGTFEPNEQKRTYQTKVEMLNMTTHEEETSF
jgi:hypothetical protein